MPTLTRAPNPSSSSGEPQRRGGSNRLPRPVVGPSRGREVLSGGLSAVALLALAVGIPVALSLFVGYPLPRSAPSHDWLTTTVTATLIIKILACVLWVVWAHFVVCIIAEWRSVRRGRMPSVVPLGGGSQLLARRLVATVLLLAGAAVLVPSATSVLSGPAGFPVSSDTRSSAAAIIGNRATAAVTDDFLAPDSASSSATAATGTTGAGTVGEAQTALTKYYTVTPPEGRRHDCLWDIAQRTMGDPLRYKEIYALNKDRIQADGSKLTDANLIRPGWQLILPADATGEGVHASTSTSAPAPVAPRGHSDRTRSTPVIPQAGLVAPHAVASDFPSTTVGASSTAHSGISAHKASSTLGGGLMIAGVVVALASRRGPYAPAAVPDQELAGGGSPELAALLDRALRNLAHSRRGQLRDLPQLAVAWVSLTSIALHFTGGDTSEPPLPWHLAPDLRSWTLDPQLLTGPYDAPAPFPGLVNVGTAHGFEVLIDLEQASGLVSVGGNLERAREAVSAMAIQAATSLWSDGAKVTFVGFADGDQLRQINPASISTLNALEEALVRIEADRDQRMQIQRELGVDGVLSGRLAQGHIDWRPRILVLSAPPTADEAVRLHALVEGHRSNIAVLVVGDAASARWRFAVDESGSLDLGAFGTVVQAHRLTPGGTQHLATLMRSAGEAKHASLDDVRSLVPRLVVAQRLPALPVQPALQSEVRAAAQLSLLGPIELNASGPIVPGARQLATEIVTAVALAPDGLHNAVLRASIWPRGVSDEVADAAIRDVQLWLGAQSDGSTRLSRDDRGHWRLAKDVSVDVYGLSYLLAQAQGADELARLQEALTLFRGEAFSATPAGRYGWAAFGTAARDARLLGTAATSRLAELLVAQNRYAESIETLRVGLLLVPTSETLWQKLLLTPTQRQSGGISLAAAPSPTQLADEMYATLHRHAIWPDAQTDALVEQVLPGYQPRRLA